MIHTESMNTVSLTKLFSVPEKIEFHSDGPRVVADLVALMEKDDNWWKAQDKLKEISTEHLKRSGLVPCK